MRLKELSRTPFTARLACITAILTTVVSSNGADPTPGDLIVSVNEFIGRTPSPTYIAEYTATGGRVQVFADVPMPGGTGITTQPARDLVYGPANAIYVFNGSVTPYLARFDVAGGSWAQQTFDGWSMFLGGSDGALTRLGQYIYAADMITPSPGSPCGIVRFDTTGGPTVRFAGSIQPADFNIGPNGILYALDGTAAPRSTVYKFDPITFASLGTVPVSFADHRGVAVAADGSILLADWDGYIYRYSASGALMDYLFVLNCRFSDIDIDPNGRVALGTADGVVVVTDLALDSYTKFFATDAGRSGNVFVTWTVVPEPTIASLSLAGLLTIVAARASSSRRLKRGIMGSPLVAVVPSRGPGR